MSIQRKILKRIISNYFKINIFGMIIGSLFILFFCVYFLLKMTSSHNAFKPCPENIPKEMSCIPGGTFIVGSNSKKWRDENYRHEVEISTFLIDKYEVSTSKYQKCVLAKLCTQAISNYKQMRKPDQPQVKVSWYQAKNYCNIHGKRLPTEAEFEAASRGPKGEIYPWGNEKAICEKAVIFDNKGRGCTHKYGKVGSTQRVGSRPGWRYGLYDMAGNAHEWVNDWYEKDYQKNNVFRKKDPKGPCDGAENCPGYTQKIVKGGSWYWNWEWARASKRRAYNPQNIPPHHFGFRCAKDG